MGYMPPRSTQVGGQASVVGRTAAARIKAWVKNCIVVVGGGWFVRVK